MELACKKVIPLVFIPVDDVAETSPVIYFFAIHLHSKLYYKVIGTADVNLLFTIGKT